MESGKRLKAGDDGLGRLGEGEENVEKRRLWRQTAGEGRVETGGVELDERHRGRE